MIADAVPFRYRARPVALLDADTWRVLCDCGFGVRAEIDIRVAGVNAPELGTDAGADALGAVYGLLEDHAVWERVDAGAWPLRVETLRRASGAEVRSFARWVGRLWVVPADGGEPIDLTAWLVAGGHGVPA